MHTPGPLATCVTAGRPSRWRARGRWPWGSRRRSRSRLIHTSIASRASAMASLRSSWKPNVMRPPGSRRGCRVRRFGDEVERDLVVIGHSIAVPLTSPSPCAAWPSPRCSRRAPGNRDREVEGGNRRTAHRQSMLPPPVARGGIVECAPARPGGARDTEERGERDASGRGCCAEALLGVGPTAAGTAGRPRGRAARQPVVLHRRAVVQPHSPGRIDSSRTASTCPAPLRGPRSVRQAVPAPGEHERLRTSPGCLLPLEVPFASSLTLRPPCRPARR